MAPSLQHRQTALLARIPTARDANFCTADVPSRWDISDAVVSLPLVQKRRQATTAADFSAPLRLPPTLAHKAKLGFFPGSTIGNYEPSAAVNLMRQFRRTLGDGSRMLIGVDLERRGKPD